MDGAFGGKIPFDARGRRMKCPNCNREQDTHGQPPGCLACGCCMPCHRAIGMECPKPGDGAGVRGNRTEANTAANPV